MLVHVELSENILYAKNLEIYSQKNSTIQGALLG